MQPRRDAGDGMEPVIEESMDEPARAPGPVTDPTVGAHGDVSMDAITEELPHADGDIQPLLTACAPDKALCREIRQTSRDILQLVNDLGGDRRAYRRERCKAIKATVAEMYSAPRVTAALKGLPGLNLIPGFALDLTTCDEEGNAWDFMGPAMRQKARDLIDREKPMFIIGSPQCTAYSTFQQLNNTYRDPITVKKERIVADMHMSFMMEVYRKQADEGRYFLHEHPAYAAPWGLQSVCEIMDLPGVDCVVGDQCQYGQEAADQNEPIKKPTRFMSNSEEALKMLGKRCMGRRGWCSRPRGGKHVICSGKHTRQAAVYPL